MTREQTIVLVVQLLIAIAAGGVVTYVSYRWLHRIPFPIAIWAAPLAGLGVMWMSSERWDIRLCGVALGVAGWNAYILYCSARRTCPTR